MQNNVKHLKTGIYVRDVDSGAVSEKNADTNFESSSTIKVVCVLLTLQKAGRDKISLHTKLPILERHLSIGSGRLNWMNKRELSIRALIRYIARYSDCVATNVLVEFIGGIEAVNRSLAEQGMTTRLEMNPIQFTEQETSMPHVGITTPHDIVNGFQLMREADGVGKYQRLIRRAFSRIDQPWYEDTLDLSGLGKHTLQIKTGSMIGIGPHYDTVMNVVGWLKLANKQVYFSSLNRATFTGPVSDAVLYEVKKAVMSELSERITEIIDKH